MATPRVIRRVAFQTLFQLDARAGRDVEAIRGSLDGVEELSPGERTKAMDLANRAFEARVEADREIVALAVGWPTHRQPAVDRAILRLAHYEITSGRVAPAVAINEAVELAKDFGTDRSPAFINAILDKIAKARQPEQPASPAPGEGEG
jgi:transcription antitermination protein NusB